MKFIHKSFNQQLLAAAAFVLPFFILATPAYSQQGGALEEVVVTAQKREQNIQDVSISISAFSGDMLAELGVEKASDILAHVPNASFFSFFGEGQTPSMCFRSICLLSQFADSFEPPVAMYVDEVYVGTGFGQSLQFFDVERVEVLKGPQGTLYGRNTTGGLVNVITRKPSEELEMNFSAEYGSYDTVVLEGGVGGPITERVRGRVAARYHEADGWADGLIDDEARNDVDNLAVRGILEFDITNDAQLMLSGHHFNVSQNGTALAARGTLDPSTGQPCNRQQLDAGICNGQYFDFSRTTNEFNGGFNPENWQGHSIPGGFEPKNEITNTGLNATINWDLENVSLTSITGYNYSDKDYIEDLDADIVFFFDDRLTAQAETFSQELRAAGNYKDATWLVGFFYYDDTKDVSTSLFPPDAYIDHSTKDVNSWAIFANTEIPLHDKFNLVLGVRYTEEERDLVFQRSGFFLGPGTSGPVSGVERSVSDESFDWRVALEWRPVEDTLLYGSVTTAFRSPDINNQFIFGTIDESDPLEQLAPVDSEKLTAYEIGLKSDFWNKKIRFNSAAFYYDFEDLQISSFSVAAGAPIGSLRLQNAGQVDLWGFEFDVLVRPVENLELNMGFGYTDSEINSDNIVQDVATGVNFPLDGNELPFSNSSLNVGGRYHVPLKEYGRLTLQADYNWIADHHMSAENTVTESQNAYGVLDLRARWKSVDGRYAFEVFGENVLDEEYFVQSVDVFVNTNNVIWGKPAWWGVKFAYNY